jgi:hypothetical protein
MKKYPKEYVVARALFLFARSNLTVTGDCFVGKGTLLAMTW